MSEKNPLIDQQRLAQIQYLNKANYYDKKFVKEAYDRGCASQDGNPRIRRTSAYLNRLEGLINQNNQFSTEHQKKAERFLWNQAIESLVIKPEDIPNNYWDLRNQIIRDSGHDNLIGAFNEQDKTLAIHRLQDHQRDSARVWADHLSREDLAYPAWFKLYAWDGMSKLGEFDKERMIFNKRDQSTVAPYPSLNEEAVRATYLAVNDYLNHRQSTDQELASVLESGNFNKVYSSFLLEGKTIIETPNEADQVEGKWVEYTIKDIDKLTRAAECTGWCIDHRAEALDQFLHKSGIDHYDEAEADNYQLQSRFFLFHLQDRIGGKVADRGSAAIHVNGEGHIDGIYGLKSRPGKNDQQIEDALKSVVYDKVETLKDGKRYLEYFISNTRLTIIDRNLQNQQLLEVDDVDFVFSLDKDVFKRDSRPDEIITHIKQNIEQYLKRYGSDHFMQLPVEFIVKHLEVFVDNGAEINPNKLLEKLNTSSVIDNLSALLQHNVDADRLLDKIGEYNTIKQINVLIINHVSIDIIIGKLSAGSIIENFDLLSGYGAVINLRQIVDEIYPYEIACNLDILTEKGIEINVNQLIDDLRAEGWRIEIAENIHQLVRHGGDINRILDSLLYQDVVDNIGVLLQNGADVQKIMMTIKAKDVEEYKDLLNQYGAGLDETK